MNSVMNICTFIVRFRRLLFNSVTIEAQVHILITSIGHLSATHHMKYMFVIHFFRRRYQRKLLSKYEQTSLNSARTAKTYPGSFKKLLEPEKYTLIIHDFWLQIVYFNSKWYNKKMYESMYQSSVLQTRH